MCRLVHGPRPERGKWRQVTFINSPDRQACVCPVTKNERNTAEESSCHVCPQGAWRGFGDSSGDPRFPHPHTLMGWDGMSPSQGPSCAKATIYEPLVRLLLSRGPFQQDTSLTASSRTVTETEQKCLFLSLLTPVMAATIY